MELWPKDKRFSAMAGDRIFSDKTQEVRMLREIIFWQKESQILGDYDRPETMPENSTWYVMTEIPGLNYKDWEIYIGVGLNMETKAKMNWDGQISSDSISRY